MIKIDFARACSSTGSILCAGRSTRVVSPLHQCLSHISQMMIAVWLDGIVCSKVAGVHSLEFLNGCIQVRSVRRISTVLIVADRFRRPTTAIQNVRTRSKETRALFMFCGSDCLRKTLRQRFYSLEQ